MYFFLYKTTNNINGKIYVGKHKTKRLDDGYMGSGKLLKRAIAKYGVDTFTFEVLAFYESEQQMNVAEKEYVTEEFCLREDTYNLCVGGSGGFSHINREGIQGHSLNPERAKANRMKSNETCERLYGKDWRRVIKAGYVASEETRHKLRENRKNLVSRQTGMFKHSEEAKAKISKANRIAAAGQGNSQYGTLWITNGTINKKQKIVDVIPEGWYKGRVINKQL